MKRFYKVCTAIFLSFALFHATAAERLSPDQLAEGQALAQQLRVARPEGDSEIRGTLTISHDGKRRVPVICHVIANHGDWKTIYESKAADGIPAERLVITRGAAGNQYSYARAPAMNAPVPEPRPLPTAQAYIPFAHSDFWLTDLGTEFIFWPEQARLKGELRLGRDCYLLESINPTAREVIRIKSFIDKESIQAKQPGILVAEGYDADGKKVKEFSIHGSSFKKVKGQWLLEKMQMNNSRTGSQTVLRFDLPKE